MLRGCSTESIKILQDNNKIIYSLNDRTNQNKKGRPKGGIAWIIDRKIKPIISIRYITSRITTCNLNIQNPLTIIGVYMPAMGSDDKYEIEMEKLEGLIDNLNEQDHKIIIIGDMNADIWRSHKNNINARNYKNDKLFTQMTTNNDSKVINISQLNTQEAPNTYLDVQGYQSCIDHALINITHQWNETSIRTYIYLTEDERRMMRNYSLTNWERENLETWDINNLSDHRPIVIELEMATTRELANIDGQLEKSCKIKWLNDKHVNQYIDSVNKLLQHFDPVHEAMKIKTLKCKKERREKAEELLIKTNDILLQAKDEVEKRLKTNSMNKHIKSNDWWTPELSRLRDRIKSLRHEKLSRRRSIWLVNIDLAKVRREYKKKIQQCKRKAQSSATSNINRLHTQDRLGFWKEIKRRKKSLVEPDICIEELQNLYSELLTQSNIDSTQEEIELAEYDKLISMEKADIKVPWTDIQEIIKNLKNNKATGIINVVNEMYKSINNNWLPKLISIILEIIINDGTMLQSLNIGLLKPIIKDPTKDNKSSNNIRPITLSDPIAVIFENWLLKILEASISISPNQFGFRKQSSTKHAVYVFRETARKYTKLKKYIYTVFLDFSKAFDKVCRPKLLKKLIRTIDPHIWLAIKHYYDVAKVIVIGNDNKMSEALDSKVGVKQGGPMSPFLFSIYINKMLEIIAESGWTCNLNNMQTGIVGYADDTTTSCEDPVKTQNTLDTITRYCNEHGIMINTSKHIG